MLGKGIKIGSVMGIPLLVTPDWFLLAGVTIWILATQILPGLIDDQSTAVYIFMALASAWFFFGSIIVHELAHSFVAKAYRIPVKSITLFMLGGVAQITREATRPYAELLMAVVGPLTSLAVGAVFLGIFWLIGADTSRPIGLVIFWLAFMNFGLAVFNIIPAFPMDGGRVFRSLMWMISGNYHAATQAAAWTGRGFAWLLLSLGMLAVLGVDVYIARDWLGGAWIILIGLFLESAARQSLFQNRVVRKLQQYRADDLMQRDPPVVDAEMSLATLARGVLELNPRVCYFVGEAGRLIGIISSYQMRAVSERLWDSTTAGDAMVPSALLHAVAPDRLASEVLLDMENGDLTHLPVVNDGQVVGVIGRDRILGILFQAGYLRPQRA
ncbi:MAG: site-2 protease family protein [Chloroflexi bacterium]|nr:site-2 protease family protein [Chloroflexota bacterium]